MTDRTTYRYVRSNLLTDCWKIVGSYFDVYFPKPITPGKSHEWQQERFDIWLKIGFPIDNMSLNATRHCIDELTE